MCKLNIPEVNYKFTTSTQKETIKTKIKVMISRWENAIVVPLCARKDSIHTWRPKAGIVKSEETSRGSWTWEWLRRRGPAVVNDRPILSWERMLHKEKENLVVSLKGLVAKTNWLAVVTVTLTLALAGIRESERVESSSRQLTIQGQPVKRLHV
jgi:hypothetical protein